MDIEIDNELYHITPTSFMIYRPEQTLRIVQIAPGTTGAFILFTNRFIQRVHPLADRFFADTFLNKRFGSHVLMNPDDHAQLSNIFDKIFDLLSSIYTERWEISARSLITTLINETDLIVSNYSDPHSTISLKERALIKQFKVLANKYFITEKQVDFYAQRLFVSSSYLYKILKKHDQGTPSSYLNDLLLQEAKFLLTSSEHNISEIADRLAFSDIFSFSKYFKKHTRLSPSSYKTQSLN